jgi:hypothetical protein
MIGLCGLHLLPMIASQFSAIAEQAVREKSHIGYLEALPAVAALARKMVSADFGIRRCRKSAPLENCLQRRQAA